MEAGLHYNWHRHYDPTLGRYTQPDPLGFIDGPNVFSYAGSAPHRYVDKDGHNALTDGIKGGAQIGGAICKAPQCYVAGAVVGGLVGLGIMCMSPSTDNPPIADDDANDNNHDDQEEPASEDAAKDIAKQIERDLGKEARRDFHDAKDGRDDRTLEQLKQDARELYEQAGKVPPRWIAK